MLVTMVREPNQVHSAIRWHFCPRSLEPFEHLYLDLQQIMKINFRLDSLKVITLYMMSSTLRFYFIGSLKLAIIYYFLFEMNSNLKQKKFDIFSNLLLALGGFFLGVNVFTTIFNH